MKTLLLSKYDDIFDVFINQYVKTQDVPLTVLDDGLSDSTKSKWSQFTYIPSVKQSDGSFSFARSMNKGFKLLAPEDVMFYSDDCYIHTPALADKLSSVAYRELSAGLVVPTMTNVWCSLQRNEVDRLPWADKEYIIIPNIDDKVYSDHDISAVCFFIKREVINKVGYFDENYVGACEYGDLDYSIRIRQHGYRHIIVQTCFVEHGYLGDLNQPTRKRAMTDKERNNEATINRDLFITKWKLN